MPTAAAPGAAAAAAQQEGGSSGLIKSAAQGIFMFVAAQFIIGQFMPKKPAATTSTDATGKTVSVPGNSAAIPAFTARPDHLDEGAVYQHVPARIAPIWEPESPLDITIVVSPSFVREPLEKVPKERKVLEETNFSFGDYNEKRTIDTEIEVPKAVQNNGTLWGHFYIGRTGSNLDPAVPGWSPESAYHFAWPLTQYIAKKKVRKTRNLLAATNATEEEEEEEVDTTSGPIITSFYHPNFTMSFIPDTGVLSFPTMHPAMRQYVRLEATGARDGTGANGWYYPLLYINTFWQLRSQMMEINSTVTKVPLHIDLNNDKNWKFSVLASMDEGAKQTARNAAAGTPPMGGGDGTEFEMIKEVLLDTNPWLLGTTVVVSLLHMVFEGLAFKNDISHWRNKKDNVGVSVRTILANVFMQTIIFLYLLDNNENTSWMIMMSQGLGIVLEFWKITKTVNVLIRPAPTGSLIPYRIVFEDKHQLSETEQKTKEYDEIAFKYVYIAAVPLLLAYAVYSVIYESHKSWYSFVITTLVGSVYAYGFLMMVPSLYINYRLKSVAHLPAKAMTYKFLNTFIDDLFAFTIKMPTLYRLGTLRDDVIFFVYLYQAWKYKVDYTRVNEFGQGGEEEAVEEKLADKLLTSPRDAAQGHVTAQDVKKEAANVKAEVAKASGSSSKKGGATKRK